MGLIGMSVSSTLREDKNVLYFHLFEAEAEAEAQTEDESEYDNYYFWLRDSQQIAWSLLGTNGILVMIRNGLKGQMTNK